MLIIKSESIRTKLLSFYNVPFEHMLLCVVSPFTYTEGMESWVEILILSQSVYEKETQQLVASDAFDLLPIHL